MEKSLPIILLLLILVGIGSFFGGMEYTKSRYNKFNPKGIEDRRQKTTNDDSFPGPRSDMIAGEIVDKNEQGFTIKILDGEAKTILPSDSMKIVRFIQEEIADFSIGEFVLINGIENEDGSITAQSIYIRPEQRIR